MSLLMSRKKDCDSVQSHNLTVRQKLRKGDLVEFHRGVYSHWAVYIGSGEVVHLAGEEDDGINANIRPHHAFTISGKTFNKARVCREKFWDVVNDCKVYINNEGKGQPLSPSEIVDNALSKVGTIGYNLLWNNCEHFARWCRFGEAKSKQVDNVLTGVAVGVAFGTALSAIVAISKYWGSNTQKENDEEDD